MSKGEKIRVLLAEPSPIVRIGIMSALDNCDRLHVVGESSAAEDTVRAARNLSPDVILMNISLSGADGLELAKQLKDEVPNARIILLSMFDDTPRVQRSTHFGVHGYLLLNTPLEKLVQAVLAVGSREVGEGSMDANVNLIEPRPEVVGRPPLPEADDKILAMIADGKSDKEIAELLGVGRRTAQSYRDRLKRRLNIQTTAGLTKYAIARNLLHSPPLGKSSD